MPKFNVIITRDITESTYVNVEAANPEAAEDAALDRLHEQVETKWEIDDGSWDSNSPYVTDVSET